MPQANGATDMHGNPLEVGDKVMLGGTITEIVPRSVQKGSVLHKYFNCTVALEHDEILQVDVDSISVGTGQVIACLVSGIGDTEPEQILQEEPPPPLVMTEETQPTGPEPPAEETLELDPAPPTE